MDGVDDVADVGVGHPGTGGEADAYFEEAFAHAVDVGWCVLVDGLLVHRFPKGTALDVGRVERHAEGLDVVVGLTVGSGGFGGVDYAGGSADSSGDHLPVGVLLPLDLQIRIESGGAEPEVGVELGRLSQKSGYFSETGELVGSERTIQTWREVTSTNKPLD